MNIELGRGDASASGEWHGFKFHGTGKEYFGIWIVNLLLSLVTLGIYSAWAKVRRNRYFYGRTELDGHNFEYHAKPKQILIGRIIVVGVLIFYNVVANINPIFALYFIIPYFLIFPWLINQALRFSTRVTSYRNVHFHFKGSYWGAIRAFILMPIIGVLSFGTLLPFATRSSARYVGSNLFYGNLPFSSEPRLKELYKIIGKTILLQLGLILIFAAIGVIAGVLMHFNDFDTSMIDANPNSPFMKALLIPIILVVYFFMFVIIMYYWVHTQNEQMNTTKIDTKHQFSSTLKPTKFAWILLTNLVGIVVTLGLFTPWAVVRIRKYRFDNLSLKIVGDIDTVTNDVQANSAVSAEYMDISGIDIGF